MSSIYSQPVEIHAPSEIDWTGFHNRWPATIDDLHPGYSFARPSREPKASSEEHDRPPSEEHGLPQHEMIDGAGRWESLHERRHSGHSATPEAPSDHGLVARKARQPTNSPAPTLMKGKAIMRSVSRSLRKTSTKFLRSASDESRRKKRQAVYGLAEAARKYGDVVGLGEKYLFAGVLPYEGT
ncbi:hypothetical protein EJ03DRAFT_352493 [Teratosphaeria nubilosa]|uniref:Uncharacterized protein n=1 Tax=Teratosphaeria nubilosa TaxID=161662 RepID=A0A6G1L634_9PEZI|nr:hypothetical protein EJ03DRAFT_352493 [Teratosphaeria nubilosa]